MKIYKHWFELSSKPAGMLAFSLHRLSGLGLLVYLYLHLALLNRLRTGPQAWDSFVNLMQSPWVLVLDAVLFFGVLLHSLNGLRLVLIGFGLGLRWQKGMFIISLLLSIALTGLGILAMR